MKITVGLNQKSVKNAINALKNAKKQLQGEMMQDFLTECCLWFINRANQHLDKSDIGKNVIDDIKSHWSYVVTKNKAKIINDSDKAVYVEFGTGQVGNEIKHPLADKLGYNYDVPTPSKFTSKDGGHYWIYCVDGEEDIDQHPNPDMLKYSKGGMFMITRGSWGEMYAYNTLVDMQIETRVVKGLWQKIKEKYWG